VAVAPLVKSGAVTSHKWQNRQFTDFCCIANFFQNFPGMTTAHPGVLNSNFPAFFQGLAVKNAEQHQL
jgi:hypothetical protein